MCLCVCLCLCVSVLFSMSLLSLPWDPLPPHTLFSVFVACWILLISLWKLECLKRRTERERVWEREGGICVPICVFQFMCVYICGCDWWSNKNRNKYLAPLPFEVRTLDLAFISLIGHSLILLLWILKLVWATCVRCSFFTDAVNWDLQPGHIMLRPIS